MTYVGDGIVPHADSVLPGAAIEILPANPAVLEKDAQQYRHIQLPRAPDVVDRVVDYLRDGPINSG